MIRPYRNLYRADYYGITVIDSTPHGAWQALIEMIAARARK